MAEDHQRRLDEDARDLHRFGYAQQLLRDMGGFGNFAVSFTIISILTGAVALFGQGLAFGGPAVNGWGWPLVTIMTLFVAASLAEIASAIPTAGAMYHWSSVLGGPGWGWFTAWFNLIGQVATTAGIDYGIALFACELLGLNGPLPLLAIYAAILASHGLVNHYGIRLVSWLNDFSVWYHVGMTALIAAFFYWFGPRRPLSFAFQTRFSTSQYPYGWAFLIGLLQAQWTLTGYDASAHITEETVDPRRNAPWGLVNSVWVSGVAGWLLLLAVTCAIGDLGAAARSPNPFLYVSQQALGPTAGAALVWAILPAMWFCGLSMVTTNARMLFAFARDGGLPDSRGLARIDPRHRVPVLAVWVGVGLAFLVAVYSRAYTVIVSLSTIGLYVSYVIPIVLALRARRRKTMVALGPWNLGRWGGFVNGVAVAWVAFITVLFVAPPNQLTGYTFAAALILLVIGYFSWARRRFKGPRRLGTEEELMRMEAALEKAPA